MAGAVRNLQADVVQRLHAEESLADVVEPNRGLRHGVSATSGEPNGSLHPSNSLLSCSKAQGITHGQGILPHIHKFKTSPARRAAPSHGTRHRSHRPGS